jgi:hypothetical protein
VVSPGPPASSTNKTDHHDITEILLKVVLNTVKQTSKQQMSNMNSYMISYRMFVYRQRKKKKKDTTIFIDVIIRDGSC